MPISFSTRVATKPEIMYRMVGEEAVLLNIQNQSYFGLDPIGARMWTVLNQSASIQTAFESLLAEYSVGEEQLRKDLEAFVEKLLEQGLVETRSAE